MPLNTRPYDVLNYLRDEEDMAGYLEAAMEDGHPAVIAGAIGDIARAIGMTDVARRAGIGRESLYKALSPNGNPEFATIMKVIGALGFRLTVARAARPARKRTTSGKRTNPTMRKPDKRAGREKASRALVGTA